MNNVTYRITQTKYRVSTEIANQIDRLVDIKVYLMYVDAFIIWHLFLVNETYRRRRKQTHDNTPIS